MEVISISVVRRPSMKIREEEALLVVDKGVERMVLIPNSKSSRKIFKALDRNCIAPNSYEIEDGKEAGLYKKSSCHSVSPDKVTKASKKEFREDSSVLSSIGDLSPSKRAHHGHDPEISSRNMISPEDDLQNPRHEEVRPPTARIATIGSVMVLP